jgi:DNA-binding transcriptional ArsR family regulator
MDLLTRPALEILAARFELLASPTRLELIQLICQQPRRVNELVGLTGQKQANVSKHLGRMLRAGFVRRDRHGGETLYSAGCEELMPLCDTMRRIVIARQREVGRGLGLSE